MLPDDSGRKTVCSKSYFGPEVRTGAVSTLSDNFRDEVVLHRAVVLLLAAKMAFGRLNQRMSKQKRNLLSSRPARWHKRTQVRSKILFRRPGRNSGGEYQKPHRRVCFQRLLDRICGSVQLGATRGASLR